MSCTKKMSYFTCLLFISGGQSGGGECGRQRAEMGGHQGYPQWSRHILPSQTEPEGQTLWPDGTLSIEWKFLLEKWKLKHYFLNFNYLIPVLLRTITACLLALFFLPCFSQTMAFLILFSLLSRVDEHHWGGPTGVCQAHVRVSL